MTIYFYEKFNSCKLLVMGMSYLNCYPSIRMFTTPSQMQGVDKKYNGHAWCKLVTTNIKNLFGFNFKKARCGSFAMCVG